MMTLITLLAAVALRNPKDSIHAPFNQFRLRKYLFGKVCLSLPTEQLVRKYCLCCACDLKLYLSIPWSKDYSQHQDNGSSYFFPHQIPLLTARRLTLAEHICSGPEMMSKYCQTV